MQKITITVDVDGSAVSREYLHETDGAYDGIEWGVKVLDMIDTINKSQVIPF